MCTDASSAPGMSLRSSSSGYLPVYRPRTYNFVPNPRLPFRQSESKHVAATQPLDNGSPFGYKCSKSSLAPPPNQAALLDCNFGLEDPAAYNRPDTCNFGLNARFLTGHWNLILESGNLAARLPESKFEPE